MKNKCVSCGGGKLIQGVNLLDTGDRSRGTATLSLAKDPRAMFFTEPSYSDVDVSVCEDCGFLHFFASNLAEMIRARDVRASNLDESDLKELENRADMVKIQQL